MSDGPVEDGLVIPEVGPWSKRKYHYLSRYLHAFTTSMRDKWPQLHYVDPFAGAGYARIRGSGEVVYSSAAIAARLEHPFTHIHLADVDAKNCEALRHRIKRDGVTVNIITGDANRCIAQLMQPVPTKSALCMTFVDPFALHFDFQTLQHIARAKSDLLILVADSMDALRNWSKYYMDNPNSSLDRFLGEPGWRDLLQAGKSDAATLVRKRYRERLNELNYSEFREVRVRNGQDRDIYTLLFASRAAIAAKIWDGIAKKDEFGQTNFGFDG